MPDGDDFTAFCGEVRPALVGALALHCGDRAVAEEIAQEALVRVWERWDNVRSMDTRSAWTYRVAFNLAASWYRRRAAERRARRRTLPVRGVEPDHEQAVVVRQVVMQLSPRRRTALLLRYYLDLPVTTTAEIMGCSEGTVKALCAQATQTLRQHPELSGSEGLRHV